ncbi:hypothetical protein F4777DRAFT_594771 [Nemania sp. FL0916]|nr:hypothetical protein F4777DRAFT_594771 [Nemania sp. FL0916]
MSAPYYSQGARREIPRPRYEVQDSLVYRAHRAQDSFVDSRALDLEFTRHNSLAYREKRYRPLAVSSHFVPRNQFDDMVLYDERPADRSKSRPDSGHSSTSGLGDRKPRTQDESANIRKRRAETPTRSRTGTPESSDFTSLSRSQSTPRPMPQKTVRFSDEMYPEAGPLDRSPVTVGQQKNTPRTQVREHPTRGPGNEDTADQFPPYGGHRKTLPKRARAGERQPVYVPTAPIISRLPTPDLDSAPHYELGLAKYDFCPCCTSDDGSEDSVRWKMGKAKMDKQVDHARAYISQMARSERLIKEA